MSKLTVSALFSLCLMCSAAEAVIVNVNADVNDVPNPVNLFLDAGTYTVTPVGIADGGGFDSWSNWSFTTCGVIAGCDLTIPTTLTGWRAAYDVISPNLSSVSVEGVALSPIAVLPTDITFFQDFFLQNATESRYHADDQLVYPDALTALSNGRMSTFTLSADGLVGFAITDIRPLADNRGGMSLLIEEFIETPTVPEPTTLLLLGLGLAGLGFARARLHC